MTKAASREARNEKGIEYVCASTLRAMDTGAWRRRAMTAAMACATLLLSSVPPAQADSTVTVTASGPARIVTDTDSSTGRIVATFAVTDPTLTATGAKICRGYGDEPREGCRYERFDALGEDGDDFDYDGVNEYTRWDVVGQPGAWTVGYPVGFDGISREECLAAAWQDEQFSADMQVLNDAGAVLSTSRWTYEVECQGIEGNAVGPDRTRVYSGRSTRSKPFTFLVLDTTRQLASYRICRYDSISGKYRGCDMERLTAADRADDGNWVLSYHLTWQPVGSSTCSYIGRKWPQAGFRVQFYDRGMDMRVSLFRGTRVDC